VLVLVLALVLVLVLVLELVLVLALALSPPAFAESNSRAVRNAGTSLCLATIAGN